MSDDRPRSVPPGLDLTGEERDALHNVQLGSEHVYRAYGALLTFHHEIGHAMDQMADAETSLRRAGHEAFADELRDHLLPAGAVDDRWTYELVDEFRTGFLRDVTAFERAVRGDLADGLDHVSERRQQARWRARSERRDHEHRDRSERRDRSEYRDRSEHRDRSERRDE